MNQNNLIQRKTSLSANLLAFCRYLREKGFALGPQEEADALQALTMLPTAYENTENFRFIIFYHYARNFRQTWLKYLSTNSGQSNVSYVKFKIPTI